MIKNFFILLLAFSFSFGAVSELVDPGSNQIIDFGYNKKSKDNKLTVPKEWINSATLAKKIDSIIITKSREVTNFDCETDYLGRENCTEQAVECPANLVRDDGIATKINQVTIRNATKVAVTSCTPNSYTACYTTPPYFINGCQWGWYLAINWKGCGYSHFEHPFHWDTYGYYGDNFQAVVNKRNQIGAKKRYTYSYKAYETCLRTDTYRITCPTDYKPHNLGNGNFECRKEYSYYKYTCKEDVNTYDKEWNGPFVDPGIDCQGQCGPYGCVCNSSTPPKNNCSRNNFTCPFDSNVLCTITTNNQSGSTVEGKWIYESGTAKKFNKTIKGEKECPSNSIYDVKTESCISPISYACKGDGFVYNPTKQQCERKLQCDIGYNDKGGCIEDVIAECPIGYYFDLKKGKCLDNKICSSGVFNSLTKLCEEKITCENGFTYNKEKTRCEKDNTIVELTCPSGTTYIESNPSYCITTPTIAKPIYSGEYVTSILVNEGKDLKPELIEILKKAGASTVTNENNLIKHNSKKSIFINDSFEITPANSFELTNNVIGEINIATKPLILNFKIKNSCSNWKTVAAQKDFPAYEACIDVSSQTDISCPTGYSIKQRSGDVICIKDVSCSDGFTKSAEGLFCKKELTCPSGYNADYKNKYCYSGIVPGLTVEKNIVFKPYICKNGVISDDKTQCVTETICAAKSSLLDSSIPACVIEADSAECPESKIGDCPSGFVFNGNGCGKDAVCPNGYYDSVKDLCVSTPICPLGTFLSEVTGICL